MAGTLTREQIEAIRDEASKRYAPDPTFVTNASLGLFAETALATLDERLELAYAVRSADHTTSAANELAERIIRQPASPEPEQEEALTAREVMETTGPDEVPWMRRAEKAEADCASYKAALEKIAKWPCEDTQDDNQKRTCTQRHLRTPCITCIARESLGGGK